MPSRKLIRVHLLNQLKLKLPTKQYRRMHRLQCHLTRDSQFRVGLLHSPQFPVSRLRPCLG